MIGIQEFFKGFVISLLQFFYVILRCFDAVGWLTGRCPACERFATTVPKNLPLCRGVSWSHLTCRYTGKLGQLNRN